MKSIVLRDMAKRKAVAEKELLRQTYRYITRNQSLSAQVRQQAQLKLNAMPMHTRPTTVKNRCIETGRGRGIMSEFRLCRYQFRLKALNGEIPGVHKASW